MDDYDKWADNADRSRLDRTRMRLAEDVYQAEVNTDHSGYLDEGGFNKVAYMHDYIYHVTEKQDDVTTTHV